MTDSYNPVGSLLAEEASEFLRQSDPVAHRVWRLANGLLNVPAIAEAASISEQDCWSALDRLADQNAIESRVAPPSSTPHPALLSRRAAMGKVAMGMLGASALMNAPQAFANTGIASTAADTGTTDMKRPMEQRQKQASEQQRKTVDKRKATEQESKASQKKVVEQRKKQNNKQVAEKRSKAVQKREGAMEKKAKRAQQESKRKAIQ